MVVSIPEGIQLVNLFFIGLDPVMEFNLLPGKIGKAGEIRKDAVFFFGLLP